MWWKRKPKVNPFTLKMPETAEEMANLADVQCKNITWKFYNVFIENIYKQSQAGNKSYTVPEKFFEEININYPNGEKMTVRPTVDFKLLKTLLTDKGFNVIVDGFTDRINCVFWIVNKNKV